MDRGRPSIDNPVVVEGIWPGPERQTSEGTFELVILACEGHIVRLLEVNMERQGFTTTAYDHPAEIPPGTPAPSLLVFDGAKLSDEDINELQDFRGWHLSEVWMVGDRQSRFRCAGPDGQRLSASWPIGLGFALIAIVAVVIFLIGRALF